MVRRRGAGRSEFTIRNCNSRCSSYWGSIDEGGNGSGFCSMRCNRALPHGGIALGIDRFVMLFGKLDNIRDCIAFPKTQKATDLMTEAPNVVDAKQLRELGISIAK